jgi:hypothetical protein
LFAPADREVASSLLAENCAEGLNWPGGGTPENLERVRFGVLKLSEGDLDHLLEAIRLAQTDWRDLLVAADFANDIGAHQAWRPGTSEA